MRRAIAARLTIVAAAGLAAVLWVLPAGAGAGTDTQNFNTTANVDTNCIVDSPTLAFGAYDPVVANAAPTANLDRSVNITLTCTLGATGITLGFGPSSNDPAGCAAPQRCMVSGGSNYLDYQIYSDSPGGTVWTTAIAETVSGGITTPTAVPIYGRIPGGQDAAVGASYADTIVATINF